MRNWTWWIAMGLATAGLAACTDGGGTDSSSDADTDADTDSDTDTDTDTDSHCPDGVCILSGTILDDTTLTAENLYLLRGGVFVGNDADETVLTIEPGTQIYGETSTDGMLVIRRHSKLIAEGTAEAPIVFTSSKSPGSRARGDWGGLILNGLAPINRCADVEGDCQAFGEGGTGWYGGGDPADDSGSLKYVRVEFAGTLISPDNELNGIAFQGVGSGTTVDYVQVHMNDDDGVEFFGGTVNAKHVLVTGVGDDGIDWTDGWIGKLQYAVVQQFDDTSDNGIEADNQDLDNTALPRSSPTLSNVTLVGSPASDASDLGLLLRQGTAGDLSNLVVTGFQEACIDVDQQATFDEADAGNLTLTNTLFDCAVNFLEDEGEPSLEDWFTGGGGNSIGNSDLKDPFDQTAPNFAPDTGSDALTGGQAPDDAFFDDVSWRGGVDPAADWTTGWTTHEAN